jgi:hypothetical protein
MPTRPRWHNWQLRQYFVNGSVSESSLAPSAQAGMRRPLPVAAGRFTALNSHDDVSLASRHTESRLLLGNHRVTTKGWSTVASAIRAGPESLIALAAEPGLHAIHQEPPVLPSPIRRRSVGTLRRKALLLSLAGFDHIGPWLSRMSISGSKSGRSRDRSRSKRAILIISIVHSQVLWTTYDVMERCLVTSFFYVFALNVILIARAVCPASASVVS